MLKTSLEKAIQLLKTSHTCLCPSSLTYYKQLHLPCHTPLGLAQELSNHNVEHPLPGDQQTLQLSQFESHRILLWTFPAKETGRKLHFNRRKLPTVWKRYYSNLKKTIQKMFHVTIIIDGTAGTSGVLY